MTHRQSLKQTLNSTSIWWILTELQTRAQTSSVRLRFRVLRSSSCGLDSGRCRKYKTSRLWIEWPSCCLHCSWELKHLVLFVLLSFNIESHSFYLQPAAITIQIWTERNLCFIQKIFSGNSDCPEAGGAGRDKQKRQFFTFNFCLQTSRNRTERMNWGLWLHCLIYWNCSDPNRNVSFIFIGFALRPKPKHVIFYFQLLDTKTYLNLKVLNLQLSLSFPQLLNVPLLPADLECLFINF